MSEMSEGQTAGPIAPNLFTAITAAQVEEALTRGEEIEGIKVLVETEEGFHHIDGEDDEWDEDEGEGQERDTPLLSACRRGALEVVDCLINHGADVNRVTRSSPLVPIQLAAWKGHAAIVERLFRAGADINCNQGGLWMIPALVLASQEGHVDVVDCLLSLGADTEAKDSYGMTALMMASLWSR